VTLRVRRCELADAEALRAIRLEALRDTPEAYGTTYDDVKSWSHDQWEQAAAGQTYFLAESDAGPGRVVGLAAGGRNGEHPGTHWMYAMYVTPSARGSGVAMKLVDAVSSWARAEGAHELYLHVTTSVERARAFYEKAGFHPNGATRAMHRDPSIHLITMVRTLG
jgi:GNAT superfamily N-acetyltransferase